MSELKNAAHSVATCLLQSVLREFVLTETIVLHKSNVLAVGVLQVIRLTQGLPRRWVTDRLNAFCVLQVVS
jgi:hypothetical protein